MSVVEDIEAGKELEAAGDDDGALAAFLSILTERPRNFPALMSAGRIKQRQRKLDEALQFFGKAAEYHPQIPGPVLAMCSITINTDQPRARKLVAFGLEQFPETPQFRNLQKLIEIREDTDEALPDFDLRKELQNPALKGHVHLEALQRQRAFLSKDDYAENLGLIAGRFPSRVSHARYMRALVEAGDYAKALQVFDEVGTEDPDPELVRDAAISLVAMGRKREARSHLDRFIGDGADRHQVLKASIEFLDVAADTAGALDIIADVNSTLADPGLEQLLAFVAGIRPPQRALITEDVQSQGFGWSASEGSRTAILFFTGFAFKTGAPFSLIDRYFAGHDLAIGSLMDRTGCLCWNGVKNLGGSFEEATGNLSAVLSGQGIRATYTFGVSAGGTAAMTYGSRIGAERALSFAGPSDVRETFLERVQDHRSRHMIRRLNRRLSDQELNVRAWLEEAPQRCPISAFFCENEPGDRIQAENIAHLDEVELVPVRHYHSHECVGAAMATGQLVQTLNDIVEGATGA